MKKLVLFFLALLLVSCNDTISKKEPSPPALEESAYSVTESDIIFDEVIVYPYQYKAEDSVYIDLELYEVKEELYTLLDSLIEIKDLCPPKYLYKDEFIFSSWLEDGKNMIEISYLSTHNFNYNDCSGFFMYKNYRFNYVGLFWEHYFRRTNEIHKFRCVSSESLLLEKDDYRMLWEYCYDNGKLNLTIYQNCDSYSKVKPFFLP